MKNHIKNISKVLVLIAVFTLGACNEEFLELTPQQSVETKDALNTLQDYEAAIAGVYGQFQNSDYYGRYFVLVPDVMSDDVKQNASANRAKEWAEFSGNSTDFIPREIWAEIYEAIDRANRIILSETTVPAAVQDELDQIKGEAYALRALAHFDLVRIFAQHYSFTAGGSHPGIPVITEVDPFQLPARSTVDEVYTQVIADLTTAIGLMNIDPSTSATFSRAAAQGLLARVYLYMEDWANAESFASTVINSGEYSLVDNADYVASWDINNEFNSESLFEISMIDTDNNGTDALGGMYLQSGYGDYLPSRDLLDLYSATDVRGENFGLYLDDQTLGGVYGNLRMGKYADINGENNTKVLRLAELYLIRAEASYNLGNTAQAQADVTTIAQRADPSAAAITSTGQALLDDILLEKRKELAFEGHRLWDLMRHRQGVIRIDCTSIASACTVTYPNDRFVLPIPLLELDTNPNIAQNPSY